MRAHDALSTFFNFIKLAFSFPGLIISFYMKRRRAVKRFREEMIDCGMPPGEAKELAKMYSFRIRDLLRLTRGFSKV